MATLIQTSPEIRTISPAISLSPATWFDGSNDVVLYTNPMAGMALQHLLITADVFFFQTATEFKFIASYGHSIYTNGWSVEVNNTTLQAEFNYGLPDRDRLVPTYTNFVATHQKKVVRVAAYRKDGEAGISVNDDWRTVTGNNKLIVFNTTAGAVGRQGSVSSIYYASGMFREVRVFDVSALSVAQIRALAASPGSGSPTFYATGDGITNADWQDLIGGITPTIVGSPEPCYVLPNGGVVKNGILIT